MPAATIIGVAVVERDGSYLVGTRPEGKPLAGYSEFPGGKCRPGESPEECAIRECLEETGLTVGPIRPLLATPWEYPHGRVELHFVLCRPADVSADPSPPFRWVPKADLASLRFPEANAAVLDVLARA